MNRNTVIVDGTKPGSHAVHREPRRPGVRRRRGGKAVGRNGIVVFKANDVCVENLTVCNFLAGTRRLGQRDLVERRRRLRQDRAPRLRGRLPDGHRPPTSAARRTAATYGIFSSNAAGPAMWNHDLRQQPERLGHVRGRVPAAVRHHDRRTPGWSTTRSATRGRTRAARSSSRTRQFDNNQDGFDTNTQINGDPPAPQNGACPNGGISHDHPHALVLGLHRQRRPRQQQRRTCPAPGGAAAGPTGTGMTISGGRNDTVHGQHVRRQRRLGHPVRAVPRQATRRRSARPARAPAARGLGPRLRLRPRGRRAASATPSPTTATSGTPRTPTSASSRSNHHVVELLREQHRAGRELPDRTSQTPEKHVHGQDTRPGNALGAGAELYFQALCDTGFGSCPAGASYPAARRGRDAAAPEARLDAEPVQGRALERVVQERQARSIVAPS